MKLAWVTDIHLNFIDPIRADAFCRKIAQTHAEAVLLGGDIGESHDLLSWLRFMEERLNQPIYFVLGNHDYYGATISEVRDNVLNLTRSSKWLRWLNAEGAIRLTDSWALVGTDGWGDARYGDHDCSTVEVADFDQIRDIIGLNKRELGRRLREFGDREAGHVLEVLPEALERFENILFLTHVPPFVEACWYEGKTSDDNWAPYFTCKAVGDVLLEMMKAWPDRQMTVLCGHTHSPGEAQLLPNLFVRTGGARYSHPRIQEPLIELR